MTRIGRNNSGLGKGGNGKSSLLGGVGRVAGLRRGVGGWALVVLEVEPRLRIVASKGYPIGDERAIESALEAAKVLTLVRLAPARQTVARMTGVPAGAAWEMAAAANMLGEAMLPEGVPAHRRGAGVIPDGAVVDGSGVGQRSALLTAWRGEADENDPIDWEDQRWTTEVAALAFLRGRGAIAASCERESGAISVVAVGAARAAARVLIESAADEGAWRERVARHVAETGALVGAPSNAGFSASGSLMLSSESLSLLRGRVEGVSADPAWMDSFGLCLGAALAASDEQHGGAGLAGMFAREPENRPPLVERMAAWVSSPVNALGVIALAVLVMLLAPLGLAAARLAILNAKSEGLTDQDRSRAEMQKRSALYRELDSARWPMTKLWADISAATPQGVHVEAMRLAPEQGLSLQGTAETTEVLNTLQANLNATLLFEKLKVIRSESTSSGVSFDLSADVVGPHHAVAKPADDWAAKSLAVRLYGEESSGGGAESSAGSAASNGGRNDGGDRRGDRRGGDRGGRGEEVAGARPAGKPLDVPGPISDEAIAALDFGKASLEWVKRKTAATKVTDAAVKARLEDEVKKIDERRNKLKSSGGGA